MKTVYPNWARRRFLARLTLFLGATGTVGCAPQETGSVKLKNSGGKLKAMSGQGAEKSRRRIPGPNDMKPVDGGR
jgi:hypothetical protein